MIYFSYITLIFSLILSNVFALEPTNALLENITFKHNDKISEINLWVNDSNIKIHKFINSKNKQILLELENTSANGKKFRGFDLSEFKGSLVFAKFLEDKQKKKYKILLQFRENVKSKIVRHEDHISVMLENYFGAFSSLSSDSAAQLISVSNTDAIEGYHVPKSSSVSDLLQNITLSGQKKYLGNKITINVKNIAVKDLLKMVAETSGFNIIQTNGILKLPKMASLTLIDIPWDQALDTILSINKLVAKKNGVILIVKTQQENTLDLEEKAKFKKLNIKQEELVTKLFPISYSDLSEMSGIIKPYLTPSRGKIAANKRTNTLIIKDTVSNIEKVKKIIRSLDTQTPQVLIKARIVEVSSAFTNELGLQNGLKFGYMGGSVAPTTPVPAMSVTTGPDVNQGNSLLGVAISQLGKVSNLNFTLQLMESETKAKIISSPRIITKNNEAANIESSETRNYKIVTVDPTTQLKTTTFDAKTAKTVLQVTPHITNDGSIVMELSLDKNDFKKSLIKNGPPNSTGSKIKTNVLIDNGSTIALGGIYQFNKESTKSGIPILRNIPLIGWLFRTKDSITTSKKEVIIFITPQILNREAAGIGES